MESIRWAFTVANVKSAEGDAKCLYEEDSEIKRVWVDQSRDVCCSVIKDCLNVCLYDNRDFSVIKNLQRLDCEGVESQTGLGPSVGGKWLLVVGMTYFKVLNTVKTVEGLEEKLSQIDDSETNFFDECTKYEVDLYRFSKGLSEFVRSDNKENGTADKEKIENVDKVMIGFFKSLERDLKSLKEEGSVEELNNNDSKNNDKAINDNGIDKLLNERVKVVKRKRKYTDEYKVLEIVRSACKGLALFRLMRFGIRENLKKHSKVVALEGEILNEVRVIKEIVLNYYLSQEEEISKVLKDYKLLHKFRNINKEYFGEKFEDYLKGLYEDKKRVLTSLVVTLNKLLRC
ncbi:hypothetical protein BY996DRAFT_6409837 [Phakopsora pachyrhizi]|nr:hypothetical protein BY996DRAFT_6409837 [Phakopsora pachyrhizi]